LIRPRRAHRGAVAGEFQFHRSSRDIDKRDVAEALGDGPTQAFLAAAQRHGITIIAGTQPLRSDAADGRVTNSTLVYDASGTCVARYDKIHLFDVDVPGKPGGIIVRAAMWRPVAPL
jgi:nitrilase